MRIHPLPLAAVEEDGCRERGLQSATSLMEEPTPLGLHHHEFVVARAVSAMSLLGAARVVSASNSSSLGGVTAGGDGRAWSSERGGGGAPQMELTGHFGCSRNGGESEVEGKEEEEANYDRVDGMEEHLVAAIGQDAACPRPRAEAQAAEHRCLAVGVGAGVSGGGRRSNLVRWLRLTGSSVLARSLAVSVSPRGAATDYGTRASGQLRDCRLRATGTHANMATKGRNWCGTH
uniref:Uncharacterized protein n=1 Tax=Oryza rufipogon TaxID=4529 RepID=A0A0E0R5F0_ORYRU